MPPRFDARRVAAAGLAALVLFLFLDALRPGRTFYYRDIHGYWSMQSESFVRVVEQRAQPLWNPYPGFGAPMLADPSYQVAYPFTWLNLVLRPAAYYKLYVVAHAFFAGMGAWLLLRRLELGPVASFCGAAAWIASGPFLSVLSQTHHFAGMAWMPWVLLALDAALASVQLRTAAALGAAAAGQLLAGSGDLCLMTSFLGLGWLVARGLGGRIEAASWPQIVAGLGIAGGIAASVSAIQWLPTLAILPSGARLDLADFARYYWSLHPASIVDFLAPRLVAELPLRESVRAALFEGREPLYAVHYLGAAAVPLALLGIATRREPVRGFAALGFLAAVTLSLGRNTPLYPALAQLTPLGLLRYPSKYLIMAGFLWAMLVALGAEAWLRAQVTKGQARTGAFLTWAMAAAAVGASIWVATRPEALVSHLDPAASGSALTQAAVRLGVAAALMAAAGALVWVASGTDGRAGLARPTLVVLAVLDLAWVGRGINATAPTELLNWQPQLVRVVPPGSRLWVDQAASTPELKLARQPPGWERPWTQVMGRLELAWPPTGARVGLLGSYDGDFTGLAPPLLSDVTHLLSKSAGRPLGVRLLQIGGVQFVVTMGDNAWPGLSEVTRIESVFRRPIRVLAVPNPRPPVYLVGVAHLATGADAIRMLGSAGFDPGREIVLESGAPFGEPASTFDGHWREIDRQAGRLVGETTSSVTAALVVLEAFFAGWRAEVDGGEAPVIRANAMFNAVVVPPGRHRVVLAYRPGSAQAGAALSASGLAVLAGLALSSLPFRRTRSP